MDKVKECYDFIININGKIVMAVFVFILLSFLSVCYFDTDYIITKNVRLIIGYTLWGLSLVGLIKIMYRYTEKEKIFKKIDHLGKKERDILCKFAKSDSNVIEITRDDVTINTLTLAGFFITESSETPFSSKVKVVLDDVDLLPYIKAYFKQ